MNSKGQSLVVFVLTIPIVFVLIVAAFDLGNLMIKENKIESEIKNVIKVSLKDSNITEEQIKKLLDKNLEGIKEIEKEESKIKIRVEDEYKPLYNTILKNKLKIDVTYVGKKEEDKIIIEKE